MPSRALGLLGVVCLCGCLQDNPIYLGEAGEGSGEGSAGETVTGTVASATSEGTGAGTAGGEDGSSGPAGSSTMGPANDTTDITGCTESLCFSEVRCFDTEDRPSRLALGDVSGNGRLDVGVLSRTGATVEVFRTSQDGALVDPEISDLDDGPRDIVAIDDDGDGLTEFAVSVSSTNSVVVFDPLEAETLVFSVMANPEDLLVGDANDDGVPDLAILLDDPAGVQWALGTSLGSFDPQPRAMADGDPHAFAIADVDGDDILDAIIVATAGPEVGCFSGDGTGAFTNDVRSNLQLSPWDVDTADFDHDGIRDVVLTSTSPDTVEVLFNDGESVFNRGRTIDLDGTPGEVRVADFDADGEPDIAVAMRGAREVLVFHGTSDLTYGEPVVLPLPHDGRALEVADIDGDGRIEIVATATQARQVCVAYSAE